jgi:FtsP/CotA-like multicopper oxidase with cupredoxin domain
MTRAIACVALLLLLSRSAAERNLPSVLPNDNRSPAGRLSHDTLELHLVVRMALWRPEADSGPTVEVAAFGEEGKAPAIPAPLIRVPVGTVIAATVRNALADSTLRIYGLVTHPAAVHDSLVIPPGDSRSVTFTAGAPGSYLYWASLGANDHLLDQEREQISGGFIVDPVGGSAPDRVLVINIWGSSPDPGARRDSPHYRNALTINGRSWPYTERMEATVGDTLRWRVLNASWRNHPMHLHGFFYRVDARGDGFADSLYAPADRRQVVTENLRPLTTMSMTWVPQRAGNWLFHCHIGTHVTPRARLNRPSHASHAAMAHDPGVHMAGLILGIAVRPLAGAAEPGRGKARRLHLFAQEGAKRGRAPRAMSYLLQRGARPPAADSVEIPGSVLVLTRGEPTDVVIVNRLSEPTAIHWHGIELESYSDGVAGWSGAGNHVAPLIAPGDSFTARLTFAPGGNFHLSHAPQRHRAAHLGPLRRHRGAGAGATLRRPAGSPVRDRLGWRDQSADAAPCSDQW